MARVLWLFTVVSCALNAESLGTVLTRAGVPTTSIPSVEAQQNIISYAVNAGDPFLLAYYNYNGTSVLSTPLHLIRYDRLHNSLTTAALSNLKPSFSDVAPAIQDDCLGSVLRISEQYGRIYVDTHINPSAGCVLVFSRRLSLEAMLSGALLAVLNPNWAILEENEIHFTPVHPFRMKAVDFERRSTNRIYPPRPDPLHDRYSRQIAMHMPSRGWCMQMNSPCDPLEFDCELDGRIAVNAASKSLAFVVRFDSGGFGPDAARYVPPERVAYVYRLENGSSKHSQARAADLHKTWGVTAIQELVSLPSSTLFEKKH